MKNIILFILLAVFTPSVLAVEVTLKCNLHHPWGPEHDREEFWKFDEATGDVKASDDVPHNVNVKCEGDTSCFNYAITETHVSRMFWWQGKSAPEEYVQISRMDGTYKSRNYKGKCVPFKQAF